MKRAFRQLLLASLLPAALLPAGCSGGDGDNRTQVRLQRIFGSCEAEYGRSTDVDAAVGECGIITTLINRFQADNPDLSVRVTTVFWPGYDQLTAQLAANDEPDIVTMHASVIPDYQARGLLEPLDEALREAGINAEDFSPAARRAVTIDGRIYGLPFDTWAPLWHINMAEFKKAGLVKNGQPVLPRSPEELLQQAEQFRRATGKPYFVQAMANEYAAFARNFYTGLMQQGAPLYTSSRQVRLQTPEARKVLTLYRAIYERKLTTRNLDYSAATASFLNGGGGVFLTGTWMVSTFNAEVGKPGRPLSGGYAVRPYPPLFGNNDVSFIDGHNWVMPVNKRRTPEERKAALRLLRFLADNNGAWARTGHLPVFTDILASPEFRALPHRADYARIADTGLTLPPTIRRQYPIENILGEETSAAITGQKSIDRALADAEHRINELLAHL